MTTTWRLIRETDLTAAEHAAIAALVARAFPDTDMRGRSWCSERPEARIVGEEGGTLVSHAAFLRRFVRVGEGEVLVADVGLVAVEPSQQGRGRGRELLAEVARVATTLRVDFGLLTTGADRAGFYATGGWLPTPTQRTLTIERDDSVQDWREATLHLPLTGRPFPEGVIVRNGYEV